MAETKPSEPSPSDVSSPAEVVCSPQIPRYRFEDIVLNPATYEALQDALTLYSKQELLFDTWGLGATHKQQKKAGICLYGPPGTGKSMAAHAIASQLGKPLLTVDYAQIESKYVGETSKNLAKLFECAKETDAVLFFDEADALLSRRVTNMSNATDVSVNQTRSVLLTLINDYAGIIVFATNFISNFDPAFMRRILSHVHFELPDEKGREELWRRYIPKKMPTNVDPAKLAGEYPGISGADISNAVLLAALRAARRGDEVVQHEYFVDALRRAKDAKQDNESLGQCVVRRGLTKEQVQAELQGGQNDQF